MADESMRQVAGRPGADEALTAMRQAAGRPGNGPVVAADAAPRRQAVLMTLEDMRKRSDDDWAQFISSIRSFAEQRENDVTSFKRWLGIP